MISKCFDDVVIHKGVQKVIIICKWKTIHCTKCALVFIAIVFSQLKTLLILLLTWNRIFYWIALHKAKMNANQSRDLSIPLRDFTAWLFEQKKRRLFWPLEKNCQIQKLIGKSFKCLSIIDFSFTTKLFCKSKQAGTLK